MSENKKENIAASLKKLEEITLWFQEQKEVDVEKGLEKVKEGAVLIKSLKERLRELDNEFQEIKAELEEEETESN
ncbi:MAG: hypothetical protein AAB567_01225 [Patescibacteria group bacterium]